MSEAVVKLENINITFKQKKQIINAVKNVSLEILDGDIYGIVGYSGAGKSTLVRTINLLQEPTSGKVSIDGLTIFDDAKKINTSQLRQQRQNIGMIFQHFNLFEEYTVEQNVAFALRHTKNEKQKLLKPSEISNRVSELLDLVGLSDRATNYPSQLSGGQKQRVAIARALANNPKVLISDEATSALDPKTTQQILQLLQDLNKKLGVTIVLITHEMDVVKEIANKVAVMQDGEIIERGTTLEIFANPHEDLTKEFINVATGVDDAIEKIKHQNAVQNLKSNQKLVELAYKGDSTDEPVLNQIYDKYNVVANILFGNIEILNNTPIGSLIVILSGTKNNLKNAEKELEQNGVVVNVIKEGKVSD
ncbi:MAG: methionine ABC transporter ATP-binding protein [Lactobacillaceae bacterium]|jgi:D-methionine transport system ATP-binding protein|nr:methionine ABC transporter ATP-binding protein [Lactobacillaceae bacterium]